MMASELEELSDLIDALKNCNDNMNQNYDGFNVTTVNKWREDYENDRECLCLFIWNKDLIRKLVGSHLSNTGSLRLKLKYYYDKHVN